MGKGNPMLPNGLTHSPLRKESDIWAEALAPLMPLASRQPQGFSSTEMSLSLKI